MDGGGASGALASNFDDGSVDACLPTRKEGKIRTRRFNSGYSSGHSLAGLPPICPRTSAQTVDRHNGNRLRSAVCNNVHHSGKDIQQKQLLIQKLTDIP